MKRTTVLVTVIRKVMAVIIAAGMAGCVSVESYQKVYLNDRDMELASPGIQTFELDFQSYREGASGGNGGKTGGGCGCN